MCSFSFDLLNIVKCTRSKVLNIMRVQQRSKSKIETMEQQQNVRARSMYDILKPTFDNGHTQAKIAVNLQ